MTRIFFAIVILLFISCLQKTNNVKIHKVYCKDTSFVGYRVIRENDTIYFLNHASVPDPTIEDGVWQVFYDSNFTKIAHEATFLKNYSTGKSTHWYRTNVKRSEETFIDGVLTDTSFIWFKNGDLKVMRIYGNKGATESYCEWYESGNVKETSKYFKGKPIEETYYYENGNKSKVLYYREYTFDTLNLADTSVNAYLELDFNNNGTISKTSTYTLFVEKENDAIFTGVKKIHSDSLIYRKWR